MFVFITSGHRFLEFIFRYKNFSYFKSSGHMCALQAVVPVNTQGNPSDRSISSDFHLRLGHGLPPFPVR
jgi:hypothetical protein